MTSRGGKLTVNSNQSLPHQPRRRFRSVGSQVQLSLTPKNPFVVSRLGGDRDAGGDVDRRGGRLVKGVCLHGFKPVEPLDFEVLHRSHTDDVTSQLEVAATHH